MYLPFELLGMENRLWISNAEPRESLLFYQLILPFVNIIFHEDQPHVCNSEQRDIIVVPFGSGKLGSAIYQVSSFTEEGEQPSGDYNSLNLSLFYKKRSKPTESKKGPKVLMQNVK